jgi:hypothetical protein
VVRVSKEKNQKKYQKSFGRNKKGFTFAPAKMKYEIKLQRPGNREKQER